MNDLIELWADKRYALEKQLMLITGLRPSKACIGSMGQPRPSLDHWKVFSKDRQPVIYDNPYVPSTQMENESTVVKHGWRIKHLPKDMSTYIAQECQPRLIAPPNSRADIDFMAELLIEAGFKGNTILTRRFIDDDVTE